MTRTPSKRIVTCAEPGCAEQIETTCNRPDVRCPVHRAEHVRQAHNRWAAARSLANACRERAPIHRPHKAAWWRVVQPADCPEAFPLGAKFSPEEVAQMELRGSFDPGMIIERGGVRKMAVREGHRQRLVDL